MGDIIYDQTCNASFQQKVESIHYSAVLAIIGAIPRTSKEKLLEELGLESQQHRPWYRKLCCLYKVLKVQPPKCPFNAIPKFIKPYSTRNLYILHPKVNPFPANVPILYPLKTTENQRFSVVFRGYKMGTLAANGLNIFWFKNILILKSYGLQVNLKVINNFLS